MRRGMKMIATAAVATVVGISAANGAIQTYSSATMEGGVGIDHAGFGFFQFDPGQWDTGLDANPRFGNGPGAGGGEFSFSGSDGAFHQQTNTVLGQGFSGKSTDHAAFFLMDYNPAPPDRSFGSFWFGGVGNDQGAYPKLGGVDVAETAVLMYVDVIAPVGKPMRFAVESDYNGNNNGRRYNFTGTGTWQTVGGLMSASESYGNFNKADPQLGVLVSFGQGNEITVVDNGSDPTYMPSVTVDNLTMTVAQASWTGTTGGNWGNNANWNILAPDGANATAVFGPSAAAQNINMEFDHFVGTLQLDSANSYTFAGAGTLALRGIASGTFTGSAAINAVAGSHTISAPLDLYSNTTVTVGQAGATVTASNLNPSTIGITKAGPGTLAVNNVQATSLTVNAGTVSVIANGSNTGTSRVSTLTLAGGATPTASLDLKDNDLIVTSGTYAAITNAISKARNGGAWNQPGLTSSTAAAAVPKNKTLGTLTGAEFHTPHGAGATFDGFTVANSDV
ncbi:MAG: hypothetical protein H7Z14_12320, partial [Anaerolineae bacterium]|nr:hypothetical protein [Phycisphaerae bacterium]